MARTASPSGAPVRLLTLIDHLASNAAHTAASLADELNVTKRTINRDLKLLEEAGLELLRDQRSNVVSLGRETFVPPIDLTIDEALTLVAVHGALADRDGIPGLANLSVVSDKVVGALPNPLRETVAQLRENLEVALPPPSQPERGSVWYRLFQDAMTRHRVVDVHYDSIWDGQAIVTRINPAFLVFRYRAWYCVGRSSFHREARMFHLGRIISGTLSDDTFEADDELTPETYFGNAWSLIRGDERHEVRVRFASTLARNVTDVRWHHTQRATWAEDDSVVLTFHVDGLDEISWWVLGYGRQAEVLSPPELREKMLDHAEAMVASYRDTPHDGSLPEPT